MMKFFYDLGKPQKKSFMKWPATKRGRRGKGWATKNKELLLKFIFEFFETQI